MGRKKRPLASAEQKQTETVSIAEQRTASGKQGEAAKAQAEADAEVARIKAESAAEKTKIKAAADAEANEMLSKSITPELIQMKEAEARLEHGWVTVQGADAVVTDN